MKLHDLGLVHPMTCTGNERLVRQWYDGRHGRGPNDAWRLTQFEWAAWAAGFRENERCRRNPEGVYGIQDEPTPLAEEAVQ